jgi:phenylacetate-CoA ligase
MSELTMVPEPRDPNQELWDPEAQAMDRERRRELQNERLRAVVGKVFERPVPLFKRKLEQAGITGPDDVKSVDDLQQIPLTVKQELRDSEAEAPPLGEYRFVDTNQCIRLGQSTGTTGTPTVTLWTRHDVWVEYECAARNWWRMGYRPGMSATHAHPAYLYGGGVMLSGTYEYFGLLNIWVPPPDTDELAEQGMRMWMRMKPDIPFVGFSLGRYFEVANKLELDPFKDLGLRIPTMAGAGQSPPLMTAGLDCFAYLGGAYADRPGHGAFLHEDYCYVQAVDPETGRDVPDGEWGNLVVTTFGRDNVLLRYDLEEACKLTSEQDPGDTETFRRGWWGGRFKDLLTSQGRRFQVSEVEHALRGVEAVTQPSLEYVVVKPAEEAAPLRVRVEMAEAAGRDAVAQQCQQAIKDKLDLDATVEVLDREALPRSGYKTNRVVDD